VLKNASNSEKDGKAVTAAGVLYDGVFLAAAPVWINVQIVHLTMRTI